MNKAAMVLVRKMAQGRTLEEALATVDALVKEHNFTWRPVGDRENNYGSINIGSDPDLPGLFRTT